MTVEEEQDEVTTAGVTTKQHRTGLRLPRVVKIGIMWSDPLRGLKGKNKAQLRRIRLNSKNTNQHEILFDLAF